MKRMSYSTAVEIVLNGGEITDEVRERLESLKVSLDKRAAIRPNGPTKVQRQNAAIGDKIVSAMVAGETYTTAQIVELADELNGVSTQKVTGVMRGLVKSQRVTSNKVKGKVLYSLA